MRAAVSAVLNFFTMKISCPYCGRMHDRGYICPKKPVRRYRYDKTAYRVHHSDRWKRKSIEIRERDNYLCVYCLLHEKRINAQGIEVHHIVPIEADEERSFDNDNLISLCRQHHEEAEKGLISCEELSEMARKQEERADGSSQEAL